MSSCRCLIVSLLLAAGCAPSEAPLAPDGEPVKQAIEAHRWIVQARSLPGRGCVFMVDLPAEPEG